MSVRSAYPEYIVGECQGYLDVEFHSIEKYDGEFKFFIAEARKSGGPVLELASGAGRMLMVLAEAGIEVVGLELSWSMIEMGQKAFAKLPPSVRKKIRIVRGDMCRFSFRRKFPLIIVCYKSFWGGFGYNFHPVKDFRDAHKHPKLSRYKFLARDCVLFRRAESCLKCILLSLVTGGKFIIDHPGSLWERWWDTMAKKYGFRYEIIEPYHNNRYEVLIGRKLN